MLMLLERFAPLRDDGAKDLHPIRYVPDQYAERDFYELLGCQRRKLRWPLRDRTAPMRRSARRVITVAAAVGILALTVAPADAATQVKTSPGVAVAPNCGGQPNVISLTGTVMHCTFDDEFDGSSLDRSKWTPVTSATSGLIAGPVGCVVNAVQTGNAVGVRPLSRWQERRVISALATPQSRPPARA
jgi:hypothetical protein